MIGGKFIFVGLLDFAKRSQSAQDVTQQSRRCVRFFGELNEQDSLLTFFENRIDVKVDTNLGRSQVARQ